jgi:hypothetical protein
MADKKPKATRAQPDEADDDIEKLIDSALQADPIEIVEFVEEATGPPLSDDEITQARRDLAEWQTPTVFRNVVYPLCQRCGSSDYFNRPKLKFLHDAFVLAEFVGRRPVDQVRLAGPTDQWPDGYIRLDDKDHNVEVTSAHGGRKLGAEYKGVTKPELVRDHSANSGQISSELDTAIQAKVAKHYASSCWLVVYLNIVDFFGNQQVEIEREIAAIKRKHAASFDAIYVLWKDKVL